MGELQHLTYLQPPEEKNEVKVEANVEVKVEVKEEVKQGVNISVSNFGEETKGEEPIVTKKEKSDETKPVDVKPNVGTIKHNDGEVYLIHFWSEHSSQSYEPYFQNY